MRSRVWRGLLKIKQFHALAGTSSMGGGPDQHPRAVGGSLIGICLRQSATFTGL